MRKNLLNMRALKAGETDHRWPPKSNAQFECIAKGLLLPGAIQALLYIVEQ